MLFNPLKVFIPVALVCFLLGGCKFMWDVVAALWTAEAITFGLLARPIVSTTTVILLLSGLQILLIGMMSDGLARKISRVMSPEYASQDLEAYPPKIHVTGSTADKGEKDQSVRSKEQGTG
jgi:hypothetical protein